MRSTKYLITSSITKGRTISNFHSWANGKKYIGAYLIQDSYEHNLWFVFIE